MGSESEHRSENKGPSDIDFKELNTTAAASIGDMARTTLGPTGMDKMFVDTNGMVIITNDGKTVLGEMGLNLDLLPAPRLLREVSIEQEDAVGDGTTSAVVLGSELLREAASLLDKGLHPTTIAHGYKLAAQRASEIITSAGTKVSLENNDMLEQVIKTAISGSGGVQHDSSVASLLVEAVDKLITTGDLHWDHLIVRKIGGGNTTGNTLTNGVVFEGDPVHIGMPRLVEHGKVACLNTDLTVEGTSIELRELEASDHLDIDNILEFEGKNLDSQVESIIETGANVVFSDKSMDERAQQELANQNILGLRRLSSSNLENIAQATGATLTDPTVMDSSDLGSASCVEHRNLDGNNVIQIVTEDANQMSLMLRGGTEQVLNEKERAVQNGFAAAKALSQNRCIVPGGGAIEMHTALRLHEYAESIDNRERLAIDAFAEAMKVIPRSLAENSGLDPIDSIIELKRHHSNGQSNTGILAIDRCIDDVVSESIVTPVSIEQQAIVTAADVASQIIRIDDIINISTEEGFDGT